MPNFLRDNIIQNVSIDEKTLKDFCSFFEKQIFSWDDSESKIKYLIRFDGKGYVVNSVDELFSYFNYASFIERIILSVDNGESIKSNRISGEFLELTLDIFNPTNCVLRVASDSEEFVNSKFLQLMEKLNFIKNKNGRWRTRLADSCVQLAGVFVMFFVSLWCAIKFSPKLHVSYSFPMLFFFVLIIFSNFWTYIKQSIILKINYYFPNIRFIRASDHQAKSIIRDVFIAIFSAAVIYFIGFLFGHFVGFLSNLLNLNSVEKV